MSASGRPKFALFELNQDSTMQTLADINKSAEDASEEGVMPVICITSSGTHRSLIKRISTKFEKAMILFDDCEEVLSNLPSCIDSVHMHGNPTARSISSTLSSVTNMTFYKMVNREQASAIPEWLTVTFLDASGGITPQAMKNLKRGVRVYLTKNLFVGIFENLSSEKQPWFIAPHSFHQNRPDCIRTIKINGIFILNIDKKGESRNHNYDKINNNAALIIPRFMASCILSTSNNAVSNTTALTEARPETQQQSAASTTTAAKLTELLTVLNRTPNTTAAAVSASAKSELPEAASTPPSLLPINKTDTTPQAAAPQVLQPAPATLSSILVTQFFTAQGMWQLTPVWCFYPSGNNQYTPTMYAPAQQPVRQEASATNAPPLTQQSTSRWQPKT